MSFFVKTTLEDKHSVYWTFHLNICGRSEELARSKSVEIQKGAPIWKAFFTQLKSPVYSLDQLDNYHAMVDAVVERLEEIAGSSERAERVALSQMFQDEHLKDAGIKGLISDPKSIETTRGEYAGNTEIHSQDLAALSIVLYKAIYRFLRRDERYLNQGAGLAYFYAAWQWFNLTKQLSMVVYQDYLNKQSNTTPSQVLSYPYRFLIREMTDAHQALAQMLQSPPDFDEAIKWLAYWAKIELKSSGLLREQMRLSLPLIPSGWGDPKDVCKVVEVYRPVPAPGWGGTSSPSKQKQLNPGPDWGEAVLHPIFQAASGKETTGRQAIRRLISDWLLPRYDFDNSVQFARLLKDNCSNRKWTGFWMILALVGLLFGLFLGAYALSKPVSAWMGWPPEWVMWACMALEWMGMVGVFLFIRKVLDHSVLPYLLLPRVAGGIMVGYIALVLSEDSYRLRNFFISENGFCTVLRLLLFWAAVLLLSYWYLYYDTLPFAGTQHAAVARGRAVRGVSVALALTLLIGFFVLGIASQMYLYTHIPQENLVLLGPVGLIDWQTFVIFVPFALLTGLVTQFIFEEKTVTTSVWAPEVE